MWKSLTSDVWIAIGNTTDIDIPVEFTVPEYDIVLGVAQNIFWNKAFWKIHSHRSCSTALATIHG